MHSSIKLLHIVIFVVLGFGIFYDEYFVKIPQDSINYKMVYEIIGGRAKYLTFLNLVLHCLFFGLCVLTDLLSWNDDTGSHRRPYKKILDVIFTTLVFPLGLFVSLMFWGLYMVDRELIYPVSMDSWFPGWLNHIMHTLPALGSLTELIISRHHITTGTKSYVPILLAYACYLSWISYIAYSAGIWVYPIFEVLDFTPRSIFMAALLLPNIFFVYIGPKIYHLVWGSTKESSKKKSKKR